MLSESPFGHAPLDGRYDSLREARTDARFAARTDARAAFVCRHCSEHDADESYHPVGYIASER